MIAENVAAIRARMDAAAQRAGRDPKEIVLCAATKMNDASRVREAIAAGVACCGENRVQELTAKLKEHAYDGASVHFIGHLQTNKVKQVVGKVDLIQSVDRPELLAALEKEAAKQAIVQDILLEINVGAEESKSGYAPEQADAVAAAMARFPHLRLRGLMAIPPVSEKSGSNCRFFTEIKRIAVDITAKNYHNISMEILSMGMTDDFEDAIACGSTMIRVGTAIFGARDYSKKI
ncbi:MAG: YggS family pyridoxal phosphate-dependent enzyme [Oscillospiraceae bacterium]|nr:YggS family pyridoxal phosphate-dependent enzyme [Oscillospiraceae bacterium]